MMRIHVVGEGSTEVDFVNRILKPHLEERCEGSVIVTAPNLQLHEFEALVIVDPKLLLKRHPNRKSEINNLAARIGKFQNPELVNRLRTPSYWIKDAVPEYNKVLDGVNVVEDIGLPTLRDRCPHFGQWLHRLEGLVD